MLAKSIVIGAYALMIIIVGLVGLRKTRSFADFFLGGGTVGPWMTAFTYAASYFSAVLFIGFAGKIGWAFGLSGLWIALGNTLVGVLAVWWLFGRRIKQLATTHDAHTMPEFLQKRYKCQLLKLFGSAAIFVFFVPYSAAVFMGLSYLFESNFDIPYAGALVAMGMFTAIYMVLGGYKSMALIDVIFGLIMTVGVCCLLWFTLHKGGGLSNITADLAAVHEKLAAPIGPPGWWPLFCLIFLTSVAPFGMPQLVQKFYAIKADRTYRIGMLASTLFAALIGGAAYFVGATTRLFLSPASTPDAFGESGAPIVDRLMPELLASVIPDALSILMLLLVLSASMSTLAALVLISSSAVVKDLYGGFVNPTASDRQLTTLMRVASAVFILISIVLAALELDTIVAILAISWGAIGSVFLGPFVWGALTNWTTRAGALASAFVGLATCLGLYIAGRPTPEAGTLGMLVSLAMNPLVSLVTVRETSARSLATDAAAD